jgi:hypothetical protein
MKRWDVIAELVGAGATGAEIGVWRGLMSKKLLLAGISLYMVDRWSVYSDKERAADNDRIITHLQQSDFDKAREAALTVAKKYGGTIIHADSIIAARRVPSNLDFAFLDGRHDYKGVRRDMNIWAKKIRSGGWLMGHDYLPCNQIARAVDERFPDRQIFDDRVWGIQIE